jgi:hypothetical protein
VQSSWLQEVAGRGDVTGSLERVTTGRSDKKNFILPNGQWLFLSLMDEHGGRRAEPGDGLVRSAARTHRTSPAWSTAADVGTGGQAEGQGCVSQAEGVGDPSSASARWRRKGLNSAPGRQCRGHCDDRGDQTDQGRIL